jgi:hypothetical protein
MTESENTPSPQQVKLNFYNAESLLHRFFWHIHALGSVFGILFLLVSSLVFLNLHWLVENVLNHRNSKSNSQALRSFSGSIRD